MTAAQTAAKCAECLALLSALDSPPMTSRELLERQELIAREYARAQARREPGPQMRLEA